MAEQKVVRMMSIQGIDTMENRVIHLHSAEVPEYQRRGKPTSELSNWVGEYIRTNKLLGNVNEYDILQAWVVSLWDNGVMFAGDQFMYRLKLDDVVVNCDKTNFVHFGKETNKERFAAEILELDTIRILVGGLTIHAKPSREILEAFFADKCEIVGFRCEERVTLVPFTEVGL